MFGHDDKQKHDDKQDDGAVSTAADQAPQEHTDASAESDTWQHPGPPPSDGSDSNDDQTDSFSAGHHAHTDSDDSGEALDEPSAASGSDFSPSVASDDSKDDLIDIKQEALSRLTPLIGHLDQTPDEKFRTLMMMIQASDDQSLVRQAYDAALEIDDEKTRAQALLDIVNEINYFTQHSVKTSS